MIHEIISKELSLPLRNVSNTIKLFEEGATIPFISRYRKEATGSLDEVQVGAIKELFDKYTTLVARRESVIATIEGQGNLTAELRQKIEECWSATTLEDIYLPYKPKRRSRATAAKELGLEPLANIIMAQRSEDIERSAARFVTKEVANSEAAISGAMDIIAERVCENERVRENARRLFQNRGVLRSKVIKGHESDVKYSDYFDCSSPLRNISSHRVLAILRAESEGVLRVSIVVDKEEMATQIERQFIRRDSATAEYMRRAISDSIKRLIYPSIEGQVMTQCKERADESAIAIFAENLRQLLFSSPLGQKRVLAVDPGFRTGCKVVILSSEGDLMERCTIYPHPPKSDWQGAKTKIQQLATKHKIEAIAIGDGTAGRESEELIRSIDFEQKVDIFMVSEDGASVYSASEIARKEFPDEDVTIRGAVSIGRRLMDPLSELVKIDPKSIGVGQYQHSVDQTKLKSRLDTVVESCVNKVGVNLNTASEQILTHISGLGESLAHNIVQYRSENGKFTSRKELLKVKRLGAKAFEQAAGFLRIKDGDNPLDNSAKLDNQYCILTSMLVILALVYLLFNGNKKIVSLLLILGIFLSSRITFIIAQNATLAELRILYWGKLGIFSLAFYILFNVKHKYVKNLFYILLSANLFMFVRMDFEVQKIWKLGFDAERMYHNKVYAHIIDKNDFKSYNQYTLYNFRLPHFKNRFVGEKQIDLTKLEEFVSHNLSLFCDFGEILFWDSPFDSIWFNSSCRIFNTPQNMLSLENWIYNKAEIYPQEDFIYIDDKLIILALERDDFYKNRYSLLKRIEVVNN